MSKLQESILAFDWITPLWTLIQNWRYRPSVCCCVTSSNGLTGWDIERYLKKKGVRSWGWTFCGDLLTFRVRVCQARYCAYWLQTLGVTSYYEKPAATIRQAIRQERRRSKRQHTDFDRLATAINHLLDRLFQT